MAQHQFMVGLIWSFAGMYFVLTNNYSRKCNIREDPLEKFQIMSIFMSLILPLVFGPISSFILIFFTHFFLRKNTDAYCKGAHSYLIYSLTFFFVFFYSLNLLVAELLFEQISIFSFILIKHVIGNLFPVIFPFLVLTTLKDVKDEAAIVFKSKSSVQANSEEMTLEEFRKHVLAGAGET